MKYHGVVPGGYQEVIVGFSVWLVMDALITIITGEASYTTPVFYGLICFQARFIVRKVYGIPGSRLDDCCLSCWCNPCVVTQLVATVWSEPKKVPGCSVGLEPAYHV